MAVGPPVGRRRVEVVSHGRVTDDPNGARADLDEAWHIAERGSMRLHQADVLLCRARLFRDRSAVAHARELIDARGYERRRGELEDAEEMSREEQ